MGAALVAVVTSLAEFVGFSYFVPRSSVSFCSKMRHWGGSNSFVRVSIFFMGVNGDPPC